MMQTAGRSGTDIHSRTETNRFQTFQHAYILRAVIAFPIFTGMMRLYFVVVPALILVAGGTSWLAA